MVWRCLLLFLNRFAYVLFEQLQCGFVLNLLNVVVLVVLFRTFMVSSGFESVIGLRWFDVSSTHALTVR